MQKKSKDFTLIKRIIRLVSAVVLIFVFALLFKSIMDQYWFILMGSILGLLTGLFLVPAATDLISMEYMFFYMWWIKMCNLHPYILDSSAILDGRVVELVKTGLFDRRVIVSSVTMDELHRLHKSSDIYSRRVKRGLESIEKIRNLKKRQFQILFFQHTPSSIREHILQITHKMRGTVVTLDAWITENAKKRKIKSINLHELSMAFRIQILPKEMFEVELSKAGKESRQAIGYTEDGMMIIIEDGKPYIGKRILAECTSVLQSTAGKIVFGQYVKTLSDE